MRGLLAGWLLLFGSAAGAATGDPLELSGYVPSYVDEFDDPSSLKAYDRGFGPHPDTILSRTLPSNKEQQIAVDPAYLGRESITVANGIVTITAAPIDDKIRARIEERIAAEHVPPEGAQVLRDAIYTSGILKARFVQLYGYFEAEIRQSYPAESAYGVFWLMPADGHWPPEIDAFEMPGDGEAHQTIHYGKRNKQKACTTPLLTPGDFHRYGVLWTPKRISFFVDRVETCSFHAPRQFRTPMYPILHLSIGGWAKPATPGSGTMTMEINALRVWSKAQMESDRQTRRERRMPRR